MLVARPPPGGHDDPRAGRRRLIAGILLHARAVHSLPRSRPRRLVGSREPNRADRLRRDDRRTRPGPAASHKRDRAPLHVHRHRADRQRHQLPHPRDVDLQRRCAGADPARPHRRHLPHHSCQQRHDEPFSGLPRGPGRPRQRHALDRAGAEPGLHLCREERRDLALPLLDRPHVDAHRQRHVRRRHHRPDRPGSGRPRVRHDRLRALPGRGRAERRRLAPVRAAAQCDGVQRRALPVQGAPHPRQDR